jgi:hypothetical protein
MLAAIGLIAFTFTFGVSLISSTSDCAVQEGCLYEVASSWLWTCFCASACVACSTLVLHTSFDFKNFLPDYDNHAIAFVASSVYTVSVIAGIIFANYLVLGVIAFPLPEYVPSAIFVGWLATFELFLEFDKRTPFMPQGATALFAGMLIATSWFAGLFYNLARENCTLTATMLYDFGHVCFAFNNTVSSPHL